MVVVIKKGMTLKEVREVVMKSQRESQKKRKNEKSESLKKLGGLLARLKKTPLEIQKEMRDGWLD